jgi:hypothetical protein
MLRAADVCLSCGEVHSQKQYALQHGKAHECPKVVMGRFPVISQPELPDLADFPVQASATRSIRDYETPHPLPLAGRSDSRRPSLESRSRGIGVPWLPLPDLGEVIW